MTKFTVSGLRGTIGSSLSALDFLRTCNAFARFMNADKILCARDARISGEMLSNAAMAGLQAAGSQIFMAGMVTTPTAVFATRKYELDAGVVVTASHNPPDENGLKFLEPGRFLVPRRSEDFISYAGTAEFQQVGSKELKQPEDINAQGAHRDALLALFASDSREPRLLVGLDTVNGAAGPEAEEILEALNCEVHTINLEPTGDFARGGEPVPDNLHELASLVRERNLDLGFAFDPDGDRLALVDERARAVGEEYTVPLCSIWALEGNPGDVVVNLSTSRLIEHVANKFGIKVHRTPVGEAHVVDRLEEVKGSCGGEGNGGFIFPSFNSTRDGLLAMAVMIELRRSQGPLGDLVDALPTYYRLREKFDISWSEAKAERVASLYPQALSDTSDGLWLGSSEFWLHLRPSNTEPVVRLLLEAGSREEAEGILKKVRNVCAE